MSEKIKWSELSNKEIDQLIQKKVMGKPLTCKGELKLQVQRNPFDIGPPLRSDEVTEWTCITCGAQGGCLQGNLPEKHATRIPHYSTDLNFMSNITKLEQIYYIKLEYYKLDEKYHCVLATTQGNTLTVATTPQAALWIAVLLAFGVEIEA